MNIEDLLLKDIWFHCLEYLSFNNAVEFLAFFKPEWCSQMRLEKYTIPSKRNFHTAMANVDDRLHRVKKMKWPYAPTNKGILSFVNLEEVSMTCGSCQQLQDFVFPNTVQTISLGNHYVLDCTRDHPIQWPPNITTLIIHNQFPLISAPASKDPLRHYLPSTLRVLKLPGETFECIFKNTKQPYQLPHLFLFKGRFRSYDTMISRLETFLETRPFLLSGYILIQTKKYLYYRHPSVDPVEYPSI